MIRGREEATVSDALVKILDGNTFVVSDPRGDMEASSSDPTGLFAWDTRFLSRWVLTIDGERLNPLSVDDLQYYEARFFLVPGTGTVYIDAKLSVIRQRAVGDGFREKLTILKHDDRPVELEVRRATTTIGSRTVGWCWPTGGKRSLGRPGSLPLPLRRSIRRA
jgi:hypothetical protein